MSRNLWAPRLLLLLLPLALPGCEAFRFSSTAAEDTVASYRRYLALHPAGEHRAEASQRLDLLVYRQARQADRPLGYRLYLQEFPSGNHVQDCRRRLAALALKRARTPADFQLLLERYPDMPEAQEAEKSLHDALAREALDGGRASALQEFLERYPSSPRVPEVRGRLAEALYADLGGSRAELLSFAQEMAGTPQAAQAAARAEKLLVSEVRETASPSLLGQLRSRYPQNPVLKELEDLVRGATVRLHLVRMDEEALGGFADQLIGGQRVGQVLAWCKAHGSRCAEVRDLARRALPWGATSRMATMRAVIYGPDLPASWQALDSLGWMPGEQAADQLSEELGSPRISSVRVAGRALSRWLSRQPAGAAGRWIARALEAPLRLANNDEVQRRGALLLLAGREAEGRTMLDQLQGDSSRALVAAFLLVSWELERGRPPSSPALRVLAASVEERQKVLKEGFPEAVDATSAPAAQLAERELFALGRVAAFLAAAPGAPAAMSRLEAEAATVLSGWRAELAGQLPDFQPAAEEDLGRDVQGHEQGRAAALKALLLRRDPVSRAVAAAICQQHPMQPCPGT